MGIEDDEDQSGGYGYGYEQHNSSIAQQNYTTHQPSYTMAQQSYNVAQQSGYGDNSYYASNDDTGYYASNDRRYVSQVGLNQAMPSRYNYQQQYQMNNRRVVKPAAVYAQRPSGWGWGSSTNSRQYYGNQASKYGDSGYDVHQNSSGGYQSEWVYN
ncbi:hypothetical protein DCAR_0416577 [Daucus carota subsp. sativus]|uniref:Uncharacterized protein n=1 Tax=Daucus carota subsp. sativus TaxID=79200 RepID=A0A165XLU5_DAUCS|nr:hypothetical protein DCAR_0416577 [Daucus carota subsp. sativus]